MINNIRSFLSTLFPFSRPLTRYFSSKIKIPTLSSNIKTPDDITPFKVTFSKELVKDLKNRLINSTVLSYNNSDNKSDGFNMNFLLKFINYWINTYDFQEREKYINKYPHFIANIRGINIHFVHVKPSPSYPKEKIVPVLCLHKWFSSFMEFYDFIPLWTTPVLKKDILYEMIIPSLPGFGFSTSTISHMHMSATLQELMFKLGHKKFDIQGGNSFIKRVMRRVPQAKNGSIIDIYKKIEPELYFFGTVRQIPQLLSPQMSSKKLRKFLLMSERRHVDAMNEDVLAIGLRDSPVVLAMYILEKYLRNINCEEKHYIENLHANNCNKLIDNLMIYWISQSITTAMKMHAKNLI